jgi:transcriptional regulator with XRE-family HTH domain
VYRAISGLTSKEVAKFLGIASAQKILDWESGVDAIPELRIPQLCTLFKLDGNQVKYFRAAIDARYALPKKEELEPFDPHWLSQQDKSKRGGLLLRAYRHHLGFSTREMAKVLEVSSNSLISDWETGVRPIPLVRAALIFKSLSLDNKEIEYFRTAIEASDAFKALDTTWLETQDVSMQAGLVLASYRKLRGLQSSELADLLGLSKQTITEWERGRSPISIKKMSRIIGVLNLNEEEASYFQKAVSAMTQTRQELRGDPIVEIAHIAAVVHTTGKNKRNKVLDVTAQR